MVFRYKGLLIGTAIPLLLGACADDWVPTTADAPAPVTAVTWYAPYLPPQRLNAVAVAGPGRFFAVGDGGTINRSLDAGATWTHSFPGEHAASFRGVHFADAQTGMIVGSAGRVLRTTDGGEHWTPLDSDVSNNLVDVFMLDASTAVVVGIGAIIRTTDGGETWAPADVPSLTSNGYVRDVDFPTASRGLAAYSTDGSFDLLISDDGGQSWAARSGPACAPDTFTRFFFLDETNGFALSAFIDQDCANLFRTSDAGETWSELGPTDARWNDVVFFDETDGVAVYDERVEVTADGGVTWAVSTETPIRRLYGLARSGEDVVSVGTGGGIVRSSDRGQTWSSVNPLPPGWPEMGNVSYEYLAGERWIFHGGTNLYVTRDGGDSWERRPLPGYTEYVDFFDANTGMTGFTHWHTRDAGLTWEPVTPPGGGRDFTAFERLPGGAIVAVGGDVYGDTARATIQRSMDFGDTWVPLYDSPSASVFADVAFYDRRIGFAAGPQSVAATNDGGDSWTESTAASGTAVWAFRDGAGLVAGAGGVWRTENGGHAWELTTGQSVPALSFWNDLLGYAAGFDGLLVTTDGGRTWSRVQAPAGNFTEVGVLSGQRILATASPTTGVFGILSGQAAGD